MMMQSSKWQARPVQVLRRFTTRHPCQKTSKLSIMNRGNQMVSKVRGMELIKVSNWKANVFQQSYGDEY